MFSTQPKWKESHSKNWHWVQHRYKMKGQEEGITSFISIVQGLPEGPQEREVIAHRRSTLGVMWARITAVFPLLSRVPARHPFLFFVHIIIIQQKSSASCPGHILHMLATWSRSLIWRNFRRGALPPRIWCTDYRYESFSKKVRVGRGQCTFIE